MKNRIIALVVGMILLLFSSLSAQAPDTLWTRTYGGDSTDYVESIIQIATGEYVAVGYTKSFGAGNCDIYVVKTKLDPTFVKEQRDPIPKAADIRTTCYPSPFSKNLSIELGIEDGRLRMEDFSLEIFDVSGRRVRILKYPMPHAPSTMQVIWDGRDDAGHVLRPGIYFLKAGGKYVGKVVKVR
jgi:hypothetical protein